ncbi:HU family DNA-binding protein [Paracoccus contaminans]|uniref:DNA-binding protein n=1 Tax=Paracoccus contaminans TaxID=1945662 RepID=A0A1W6CZ88_9RHOB|nr:HU family DNA-binding protein [Paracoccus contaminans]ARJ70099.1 hypothetical protein B0A89_11110 [Paracoccus contaminans]
MEHENQTLDDATSNPVAPGTHLASSASDDAGLVLHKAEFLDRVSAASNVPRAQVRRIVEATLAELGQALTGDEALVLPPLGTVRVRRRRSAPGGEIVLVRLRRNTVPAEHRPAKSTT